MATTTGNGTTIAFTTTAITSTVISIGDMDFTRPRISDSTLGTIGYEEYLQGDLVDHGEVEVTCVLDPALMATDITGTFLADPRAVPDTCTITYDDLETAGSKVVGTAFLTGFKVGAVENNARIEGTFTFSWDGKTGPTWTAGTL